MAKYNYIQPFTFEVNWEKLHPLELFVFSLPKEWEDYIKGQYPLKNNNRRSIPYKSLKISLACYFSDICWFGYNIFSKEGWIFSKRILDVKKIKQIIMTWLVVYRKESNLPDSEDVIFKRVKFSPSKITEDSTKKEAFIHIPHILTDILSQKKFVVKTEPWTYKKKSGEIIEVATKTFHFHRINDPSGVSSGMVSWPPINFKSEYYSYYLNFDLETIPQRKYPLIHCSVGIRRWANVEEEEKIKYLSSRDNIHVYLNAFHNDSQNNRFTFGIAEMNFKFTEKDKERELQWLDKIPEIFSRLELKKLPEPNEACMIKGLEQGDHGWITAILFANKMSLRRNVKSGIGPVERKAVFDSLANIVEQFGFIRSKPLEKHYFQRIQQSQRNCDTKYRDPDKINFEQSLKNKFPKGILIRIFLQNLKENPLKEWFIKILKNLFPEMSNEIIQFELATHNIFDLVPKFDDEQKEIDYYDNRFNQLSLLFKRHNKDIPEVILYELKDFRNTPHSKQDPRLIIRKAIISQDSHPQQFDSKVILKKIEKYKDEIRKERAIASFIKNIVLDGLLGVGIINPNLYFEYNRPTQKKIVHNYTWIGLLLRYRRKNKWFPMAVKITPNSRITVKTKTNPQWINYHNISISETDWGSNEHVRSFFYEIITEANECENEVICIMPANNWRKAPIFPFLSNTHIEFDKLTFGKNILYSPDNLKNVNLVRMRTSDGLETPEGFGTSEDQTEAGIGSGIFEIASKECLNDDIQYIRSCYSLGPRSDKFTHNQAYSKVDKPHIQFWNPNPVEFTVMFKQKKTDLDELLYLSHTMRFLVPTVKEPTIEPLPLFLGRKLLRKFLI